MRSCDFHFDHDPKTEAPLGPKCQSEATLIVVWKDGRFSYGCADHGGSAIDPDRRALIAEVLPLTERG